MQWIQRTCINVSSFWGNHCQIDFGTLQLKCHRLLILYIIQAHTLIYAMQHGERLGIPAMTRGINKVYPNAGFKLLNHTQNIAMSYVALSNIFPVAEKYTKSN